MEAFGRSVHPDLVAHLVVKGYLQVVPCSKEDVVVEACEKNDLETLQMVRKELGLTWDERVAGVQSAQKKGNSDCEKYLQADDVTSEETPAKKRKQKSATKNKSNLDEIHTIQGLLESIQQGSPASYKVPLEHAMEGKGLKMAHTRPNIYGTNDCLKKPLDVNDLSSIKLWLGEIKKLDVRATAGQGSLKACLGHFRRVHHANQGKSTETTTPTKVLVDVENTPPKQLAPIIIPSEKCVAEGQENSPVSEACAVQLP